MAFLDFQCPACERLQINVWGRSSQDPPLCTCRTPMEVIWLRSAAVHAWEPGQRLKAWGEDGKDITFNNLHEIRKYEKESERKAADGVGQVCIARDFSQNKNNMLDACLPDPSKRARPFTHDGRRITVKRGARPQE